MSRLTMTGAACALWLAASPAAAEPFQNFVDMCLQTNVDRQAAGGQAKALGWHPIPDELVEQFSEGMREPAAFTNISMAEMTSKGPPADLEALITGWGRGEDAFGIPGVLVDACMVIAMSGDASPLTARLGERLGASPVEFDGEQVFLFSRQGGGFRDESALADLDDSEFPRIAREQKIYMAGVVAEEGFIGLVLAALRPMD